MTDAAKRITIGVQWGNLLFSFETDESGTDIESAIGSINKLISSQGDKLHRLQTISSGSIPAASPSNSVLAGNILDIPPATKRKIQENIRQVSYWNLVLLLLYYSKESLGHDSLMSLSAELGKPVSYNWLDTEFHRRQYRGLVRSENRRGSKGKVYSLNEPGRRRIDAFLKKLLAQGVDADA